MALGALVLAIAWHASAEADEPRSSSSSSEASKSPRRPDLTDPVLCRNVSGFRDFAPRDDATLTRDEKLQIYYEPFNYLIVRDGDDGRYRAHLVQDVRIRKAGSDRPLQSMKGVIDYTPESDDPPTSTYLYTSLSLKDVPLGSYEIDLILRDQLADDEDAMTVRTLPFEVVSSLPDEP